MSRFIEGLTRHQGVETGAAFAKRIGVSAQFWSDLRRGRRSLPRALAARLIAMWPDLEGAYIDDVRDDIRARRAKAAEHGPEVAAEVGLTKGD